MLGALRLTQRVCEAAELSLSHPAKTTVYLRSASDLWIYEEIREAFMKSSDLPAIELVAVQSPGPVPNATYRLKQFAANSYHIKKYALKHVLRFW
jgi:hypothetical protein